MSKKVKFGTIGASFPPMRAALESVQRIEALGFDFVDYADQIASTNPSGMLGAPVPEGDSGLPTGFWSDTFFGSMEMCSAASVLTEDLEIMLAVIDPLRRSPAVMAQEMMTLQHMSQGRMTFAIGSGENKQFEPYGETRSKPFARLEEAVHIWLALWESNGKPVTRDSEFWPLKNAVFPIPMYTSGRPHLLFVGAGERITRLSGAVGEGWLTFLPGGTSNDNDLLKQLIDNIKQAAVDAGRDPDALRFVAQVVSIVADTDEKAWELARHPNIGWLVIATASIDASKTWEKWGLEHPLGQFNWAKDMDVTAFTAQQAEDLAPTVPDIATNSCIAWGTPERVAGRIQPMLDAGINEVCFFNLGATADPEYSAHWPKQISRVIELLGGKPLNTEGGDA